MISSITTGIQTIRSKLFSNDLKAIPPALNSSYYRSMDGLRGFAILSVILCHVGRNFAWLNYIDGTVGVHIFFILSGFLITTLLLKEKVIKGKISMKDFYIRRALRIIPVAYLFLTVVLLLNYIFNLQIAPVSIIGSFAFFQNMPITHSWQVGHFWTLSTEEQFYLLFPALIAIRLNGYISIALILIALIPILEIFGFHNIGIFYTNRTVHVLTFILINLFANGTLYILAGSLTSILMFKKIINISKQPYFLSFSLFALALIIHFFFSESYPLLASPTFSILICTCLVLNLYKHDFLASILSTPALTWLGKLSYSLYIWQQLFTFKQPWRGSFPYSGNVFLNIGALFIVASCSYYFYERFFLKLKRHFKVV